MARRYFKKFIYGSVLVIPFVLLIFQPSFLKNPRMQLMETISGPIQIVRVPLNEFKKLINYHRTHAEYISTKHDLESLKSRLMGMEEVLRENQRLNQLLNFKNSLVYSSIAALVIGRDPTQWNDSIIINKGAGQGIAVGMPVLDPAGVVGKIAEVGRNKSRVILVTDPNFSVAAIVQRTRESGLLTGTLQGLCRLRYLTKDSQIKVSDKIITSKLSSSFPEGIEIGEVVSVTTEADGSIGECLIEPSVGLSQLEDVLVIKN